MTDAASLAAHKPGVNARLWKIWFQPAQMVLHDGDRYRQDDKRGCDDAYEFPLKHGRCHHDQASGGYTSCPESKLLRLNLRPVSTLTTLFSTLTVKLSSGRAAGELITLPVMSKAEA
jgi:hypothetical protein